MTCVFITRVAGFYEYEHTRKLPKSDTAGTLAASLVRAVRAEIFSIFSEMGQLDGEGANVARRETAAASGEPTGYTAVEF